MHACSIILPQITVWADHSYRRNHATVRHTCTCILWCKWVNLTKLSLHNCKINVSADFCFYTFRRTTKGPCYCETFRDTGDWEMVSCYNYIHKQTNSIMNQCLSWLSFKKTTKELWYCQTYSVHKWWLKNCAIVRRILWSRWLRLVRFNIHYHCTIEAC